MRLQTLAMLYIMSFAVVSYSLIFYILANVTDVYSLNYFNKIVAFFDLIIVPLAALLTAIALIIL